MLFNNIDWVRPDKFNPAGVAVNAQSPLLGQTGLSYELDRTKPIAEVLIRARFQIAGGALTLNTTAFVDGILGLFKRIRLRRPSGVQAPSPQNAVDFSGIGLIEYCANAGINLPTDTLGAIIANAGATIAQNTWISLVIRIPYVFPGLPSPTRQRCTLPCHTWTESPKLEIDFETAANMYTNGTAGVIANMAIDVALIRDEPNTAHTTAVSGAGGYIPADLTEANYTVAPGTTTEQSIPIALHGRYLTLQLRSYLGGANLTRNVPDAVTIPGQETSWELRVGGNRKFKFFLSQLLPLNDLSRPLNSHLQATSPALGRPVNAAFNPGGGLTLGACLFQTPASVMLDFMNDAAASDGAPAYDFGSTLDAETPFANGQKVELAFLPANVATNGSVIWYGGHRLWGDLSNYMAVAA